jgi:pilus assembly protein CpaE
MVAQYSTANAFQNSSRLDGNFLHSLLARHSSGLFVLASPEEFSPVQAANDAIDKLLSVARQCFDYVVVDAGSRIDLRGTALFEESSSFYLITQVGVSELRNSNRLISQFFSTRGRKLQIVLNHYTPHALLFDDQQITKALTRPAAHPEYGRPDCARRLAHFKGNSPDGQNGLRPARSAGEEKRLLPALVFGKAIT